MRVWVSICCLALAVLTGSASACDYPISRLQNPYKNAREHIHLTPLVFEGVALGWADENERRSVFEWAGPNWETMRPMRFRVSRVWKGAATPEQIIWVDATDCVLEPFEAGQPYLVMAERDAEGRYSSGDGDVAGRFQRRIREYREAQRRAGEPSASRADTGSEHYFSGLGSYRAVLRQMAEDGVLEPRLIERGDGSETVPR